MPNQSFQIETLFLLIFFLIIAKICSKHFTSDCFHPTFWIRQSLNYGTKSDGLKKDAVPTLYLSNNLDLSANSEDKLVLGPTFTITEIDDESLNVENNPAQPEPNVDSGKLYPEAELVKESSEATKKVDGSKVQLRKELEDCEFNFTPDDFEIICRICAGRFQSKELISLFTDILFSNMRLKLTDMLIKLTGIKVRSVHLRVSKAYDQTLIRSSIRLKILRFNKNSALTLRI